MLDYDTIEQRRLIRLQRRKLRNERFNPRYVKTSQNHQTYRHRHLKVDEENNKVKNFQEGYNFFASNRYRHFPRGPKRKKKQNILTQGRQFPIERQAGAVGLLAGNPAGAGLAWFASLVGLAAMAREPLATVLNGVTSWEQLFNGEFSSILFNKIILMLHIKGIICIEIGL